MFLFNLNSSLEKLFFIRSFASYPISINANSSLVITINAKDENDITQYKMVGTQRILVSGAESVIVYDYYISNSSNTEMTVVLKNIGTSTSITSIGIIAIFSNNKFFEN